MNKIIGLMFLASVFVFFACEKNERVDMESFVAQLQKGVLQSDRVDAIYRDGSVDYDTAVEGGSLFYPMMFLSDGTCRKFVWFGYSPFIPRLYFEYNWEVVGNSIVSGGQRLKIRSFKDGRFVMEGMQFGREDEEVDYYVIYGYIETAPEVIERYLSYEEYYRFREEHPEFWEPNYQPTESEQ